MTHLYHAHIYIYCYPQSTSRHASLPSFPPGTTQTLGTWETDHQKQKLKPPPLPVAPTTQRKWAKKHLHLPKQALQTLSHFPPGMNSQKSAQYYRSYT